MKCGLPNNIKVSIRFCIPCANSFVHKRTTESIKKVKIFLWIKFISKNSLNLWYKIEYKVKVLYVSPLIHLGFNRIDMLCALRIHFNRINFAFSIWTRVISTLNRTLTRTYENHENHFFNKKCFNILFSFSTKS